MKLRFYILLVGWIGYGVLWAQQGQVAVPRVESMPNEPTPFNVRDWRQVAQLYDAFVFDINKTGQHLPFIYFNNNGFNYPERKTFGLHTYVGTFSPQGNEAINVLPTLVGSTLVGIDKSNQHGEDYILMSQDFFSKRNGEGIYLNNPGGRSGIDWWYDLMPNVFFYQLYDLYPNMGGEAEWQFGSVADQFLRSVRALGGSGTPWQPAFMDYRAFNFLEMTPIPQGVRQPEAAGAYAWVLYNAGVKTGNRNYITGAEWSLEFLSNWNMNPSYELQLPYGIYTAARMNAELQTSYDIDKMINWKFNRGFLRGWGTIVGRWGGLEVSGLVGEANDNDNDYAFQLNGVQHAAALVPMVRYDKRYARAIGKWVLNLANATRLFYPGFLPANLQDASEWSATNDPDRVIGYEALRERFNGLSPFSTGDALGGGWAATNLALYGSSSIGYLGAMIDRTEDPRILQIDLLKTDFFRAEAYPTYLYFNPYATERSITLNAGTALTDIYNALTETFVLEGVSGDVQIAIPGNEASMLVLVPHQATITYDKNKTLANGVVIDYSQTVQPYTLGVRIKALMPERDTIESGDEVKIYLTLDLRDATSADPIWSSEDGTLTPESEHQYRWKAPETPGIYEVKVLVTDDTGSSDSLTALMHVVAEINVPPVIHEIIVESGFAMPGAALAITCDASDANGDELAYSWQVDSGVLSGMGRTVSWTAPLQTTVAQVTCMVEDGKGGSATASRQLLVKDLSGSSEAKAIAYYPFEGNALDISGNDIHGNIIAAILTQDHQGRPGRAYRFNGGTAHINVPFKQELNVSSGISVVVMFRPNVLPDRESFLVSHGSWQNRWKLSITPDRKLRWTVNSTNTIRDLDSDKLLETQKYYHAVVTYDGQFMTLYLDGELLNATPLSGQIRSSTLPLLIGQMLPGDQEYNFNGVIDEVRIYDRALLPQDVSEIYNGTTTAASANEANNYFSLFPNPVREMLFLELLQASPGNLTIEITDVQGRLLKIFNDDGATELRKMIPVNDLIPGIYHLRVSTEHGGSSIQKFMKI